MKLRRKVKVAVYGVSSEKTIPFGGPLWIKKVAEELEKYNGVEVYKVPEPRVSSDRVINIVRAYIEGLRFS